MFLDGQMICIYCVFDHSEYYLQLCFRPPF